MQGKKESDVISYKNLNLEKNPEELPVLFDKKENCCGCTACFCACPVHAISMEIDEEGFLYPCVDAAVCIKCYKCMRVCLFKKDQRNAGYY